MDRSLAVLIGVGLIAVGLASGSPFGRAVMRGFAWGLGREAAHAFFRALFGGRR
jgi:hypothetical protein